MFGLKGGGAQEWPTLAVNGMRRGLIRDKGVEFNKGEQCHDAACDPPSDLAPPAIAAVIVKSRRPLLAKSIATSLSETNGPNICSSFKTTSIQLEYNRMTTNLHV